AAAHAASLLQQCFANPDQIENQKSKIENALGLLRLHHIRLRFPLPEPSAPPAPTQPLPAKPEEYIDPEVRASGDELKRLIALARARRSHADRASDVATPPSSNTSASCP